MFDVLSPDKVARIRELNDAFRTSFKGGKVMMTASVAALASELRAAALFELHRFNNFNDGNDPRGEHDFGNFDLGHYRFFFQISYFGRTYEEASEDPSDPNRTKRVLVLMLAEDW